MSWSDEPENEERWNEWERMVGDASSTIQSLAECFDENSAHDVLGCASRLMDEIVAIHDAAGAVHHPIDPVIDVAGEADLVARWKHAQPFLDHGEEDHDKAAREAGVAFEAIGAAARKFCDVAERSLCRVAGEVEEAGCPSASSLSALADDAAKLVEWTHVYGASVLGLYRATGSIPDAEFGGGTMEDMLQYERAEQLAAALVGAHPWQ